MSQKEHEKSEVLSPLERYVRDKVLAEANGSERKNLPVLVGKEPETKPAIKENSSSPDGGKPPQRPDKGVSVSPFEHLPDMAPPSTTQTKETHNLPALPVPSQQEKRAQAILKRRQVSAPNLGVPFLVEEGKERSQEVVIKREKASKPRQKKATVVRLAGSPFLEQGGDGATLQPGASHAGSLGVKAAVRHGQAENRPLTAHKPITHKQPMGKPESLHPLFSKGGADQSLRTAQERLVGQQPAEGVAIVDETPGQKKPERVEKVIALAKATIKRKQAMRRKEKIQKLFSGAPVNFPKTVDYTPEPILTSSHAAEQVEEERPEPKQLEAGWQLSPVSYDANQEESAQAAWMPKKSPSSQGISKVDGSEKATKQTPPLAHSATHQETQWSSPQAGFSSPVLVGRIGQGGQSAPKSPVKREQKDNNITARPISSVSSPEETRWEVPVEGLGGGVTQILGDTIGGVVAVGQKVIGTGKRRVERIRPVRLQPSAKSVAVPLKEGQRIKTVMANKVGGGVQSIFSGFGLIARGGANIIIGSLGCFGGALICLTGISKNKITSKNPRQSKPRLIAVQK
ncbi:MAG: hypothetical protein HQL72_04010 [Magnetococcales bacterium]|nr:hypothetical protein [Magnetococcales bacterium]